MARACGGAGPRAHGSAVTATSTGRCSRGGHLVGVRPVSRDQGSATVWAVGVICALGALFGGVLAFGQVLVVRHRAAAAADLAVLAAASQWRQGEQAACRQAARVAGAQGAVLARCAAAGEVAEVTATVSFGPFVLRARSRAGPPRASSSRPTASGAVRSWGLAVLPGQGGGVADRRVVRRRMAPRL
ncbi:Rv3654c family TadE-like protein [Streptomyces sp. NPDC006879]|uniref:Rv3654c family TadE-like protein n=1 Tax=Streptomyces sp. NPDC006879 TaxID=3364767 RepID=UPI00367DA0D6